MNTRDFSLLDFQSHPRSGCTVRDSTCNKRGMAVKQLALTCVKNT